MKKYINCLVCLSSVLISFSFDSPPKSIEKPKLMWFDATANFMRLSYEDSIDFYLGKIKDLGFTHAVVDIRPISGEVLYKSKIAPELKEWKGFTRPDFDFLGYFIEKAHQLGLEVHASLNIFVGGNNFLNRGLVYSNHPEWVSMVYTPEKGIIPITGEKKKYSAMINPINEEFIGHILAILKELVTLYPELDGLILDRARYDGISADFSELSKSEFEKYLGKKIKQFPDDIFKWEKSADGSFHIRQGMYYKKWLEWRSQNIYNFIARARSEVKAVNPDISFGAYSGAWYPSYYEVGVNFASKYYDPSVDFDWATHDYKGTGYAELLDLYIAGNYYMDVTKKEYLEKKRIVQNETDSQAQSGLWYCVEGSCENIRKILKDNDFFGGILVSQFYENRPQLSKTIEMNLKASDGLMVFDITHIIEKDLWKEVEDGMRAGGISNKSSKAAVEAEQVQAKVQDQPFKPFPLWVGKTTLFEALPNTPGEIIFVGNSITDGCEWAEMFGNPSIKNRGIGGDKIKGVLLRLPEITESLPQKIFIQIG